jgi:hypothetical protein
MAESVHDQRSTGTRGGCADPAQAWSSSFRSGIPDRTGLVIAGSETSAAEWAPCVTGPAASSPPPARCCRCGSRPLASSGRGCRRRWTTSRPDLDGDCERDLSPYHPSRGRFYRCERVGPCDLWGVGLRDEEPPRWGVAVEMGGPSRQPGGTSFVAGRSAGGCPLAVRRPAGLPVFWLASSATTGPLVAVVIAARAAILFGRRAAASCTHIRGTRSAFAAIPRSGGPYRLRCGVEGGL